MTQNYWKVFAEIVIDYTQIKVQVWFCYYRRPFSSSKVLIALGCNCFL